MAFVACSRLPAPAPSAMRAWSLVEAIHYLTGLPAAGSCSPVGREDCTRKTAANLSAHRQLSRDLHCACSNIHTYMSEQKWFPFAGSAKTVADCRATIDAAWIICDNGARRAAEWRMYPVQWASGRRATPAHCKPCASRGGGGGWCSLSLALC